MRCPPVPISTIFENRSSDPFDYGFTRYTLEARKAVFFSRFEAAGAGNAVIDPEHMLLGVMRAVEGLRTQVFEAVLSVDQARAELAAMSRRRESLSSSVPVPFSERARQILRFAAEQADSNGHRSIGVAHLIAGVLRLGDAPAASLLAARGITHQSFAPVLSTLLNEESP